MLLAAPLILAALWMIPEPYTGLSSIMPFWVLVLVGEICLCLYWAPISAFCMLVVTPRRRATAQGLSLLASHLLGDAASPVIIGQVGCFPPFLRFLIGKCRNCPFFRAFDQEMKGKTDQTQIPWMQPLMSETSDGSGAAIFKSSAVLKALAQAMQTRVYQPGHTIVEEGRGENLDKMPMFILTKGTAKATCSAKTALRTRFLSCFCTFKGDFRSILGKLALL